MLVPSLLLLILAACAPAEFGDQRGVGGPAGGDGPPTLPEGAGDAECPPDPDCAIGGDCSLYECPEHWDCTMEDDGGETCLNPGPDYPDDGGAEAWDCNDEFDVTRCRREGGDLPDDGGDETWDCWREAEFVVCENDDPDYPDDGGDERWDCWFIGEFRVCTTDDGGDDGRDECVGESCDPPPCTADARASVTFTDDRDGSDDGEIYALGDGTRDRSCATVTVEHTGYYQVYDSYIAESCTRQLDETGYLTISNSCNPSGEPREENVGDHFLVDDSDNTMSCTADADCGGGLVCRDGTRTRCCVDPAPVFMGTFLLRAGDNELCINHWCPEYRAGRMADGHANAGCDSSIDSIHVVLDGGAFLCPGEDPPPAGCR